MVAVMLGIIVLFLSLLSIVDVAMCLVMVLSPSLHQKAQHLCQWKDHLLQFLVHAQWPFLGDGCTAEKMD